MTRPSFAAYLSSARVQLCSGAPAFAAIALTFVFCAPSHAGAQTYRAGAHGALAHTHKARARSHSAGARAQKAACVAAAHAKHGSHACSLAKGHKPKPKTKTEGHHKHATGGHRTPPQGKAQTSPASGPGASPGTTCSEGLDATLNEEGTFSCAGGGEPGCQEGFAPVVAGDGATLVCEPEPGEAGGEEEG